MTPDETIAALLRVEPLAECVTAWLVGEVESLESALGLQADGPGQRSARTRYRLALQHHHLRRAWNALPPARPWPRSVELDRRARRFESTVWPRWRARDDPPDHATEVERALFAAARLGPLPGLRRLHDLCNQ